ncbi:hypothetical protein M8J77_000137 [Diaphorina citri]|nr:hypothetical protein M8J77_000137 [Diaphorina citri]
MWLFKYVVVAVTATTIWRRKLVEAMDQLRSEMPRQTGVTRCKAKLRKWCYTDEDRCDCGSIQTEAHLLSCPDLPETCTMEDLQVANDKTVTVTRCWMNKI